MDAKEAKERLREKLNELKKNDPDRRAALNTTVEKRMRGAIDNMTRDIKEHNHKQGRDLSEHAARKQATDLANSIHREDQEKGKR